MLGSRFLSETVYIPRDRGALEGSSSKLNIGGALPYLPNPCKDVTEIGAALVSKAHWDPKNVVVKCDLDNDHMAAALNQFVSRYQTTVAPTALLYFAGHGAQVGGKAYAFGINAAPDTIGTAEFYKNNTTATLFVTDAQDLQASIGRIGKVLDGGALLLVTDACRDNPLITRLRSTGIHDIEKLDSLLTPMGVESAFSTSEGANAADGSNLSPYARSFHHADRRECQHKRFSR